MTGFSPAARADFRASNPMKHSFSGRQNKDWHPEKKSFFVTIFFALRLIHKGRLSVMTCTSGQIAFFHINRLPMLKNYLITGFRNLMRHKAFSLINIAGLAIGLASSILIVIWIKYELSYDRFHVDAENIHRITCQVENINAVISPAPLAPAIRTQFPDISEVMRLSMQRTVLFKAGAEKYEEKRVFYADSNFFRFFSFPLQKGNPETVLAEPQSVVISRKMAEKYFGNQDPVGQTMQIDNQDDLIVTGVLDEVVPPSHLKFDFIIPMSYLARTERDIRDNVWDNFNYYSYIRLGSQQKSLDYLNDLTSRIDQLYSDNEPILKIKFDLQPVTSIHLHSNFLGDVGGHGNIQYVYIFSFIAAFIILIACINFMNLSTARSARRAREVGFRKVAGALRAHVIGQFLAESSLIAFISLAIAGGLVLLVLPSFNIISGQEIELSIFDGQMIAMIVGLTLAVGLLAGSYPALYLSGFQPVKVLSMQRNPGGGHQLFRNILVITQFVFSIVLIIGTVVVRQQQQFIREQNLGFDKENLLYVALRGKIRNNPQALKSALERNSLTEKYTLSNGLPTDLLSGTISIDWEGKNPNEQVLFATLDVDDRFFDVFKMTMRSGRSFSRDHKTEGTSYIVNEKALNLMGFDPDEAIGKPFTLWEGPGTIVGVARDFHFRPIQQPIDPLVIRFNDNGNFLVVRTRPGETDATIRALEKIYQEISPEYPFEYGFIDHDLDNLYQSEKRLGKLVNIFALLAIFISCLGLYGLSAFLAERRKKEIGIRKVVGASITQVVYLLVRDFTRPIWIAMVIALPLAFITVSKWLENFAYHVELKWWILVLSCLVAWLFALITVGFETVRAAIAHPSEALHNE